MLEIFMIQLFLPHILLKYFPMDILVHRHVKIPQYNIPVKHNIKAVYEYKMYLINTKQGKRITFSAPKIALKELFRKLV